MKTHHPFKLGSPNVDQSCKITLLRSPLFYMTIDLDLQGQIELQSQYLPHFELPIPKLLPILGVIEIDLQFNFKFQSQTKLSFLCTSIAFFGETSLFESWENWKISEGVNQFKEQLLGIDCFMVGSYWVCHWKKTFWVGGCDVIGGLAYLLFCAAYWSRQPRVFRRLSRSCSQYVKKSVFWSIEYT